MTPDPPVRWALFLRVSDSRQQDEQQLMELQQEVARRGGVVVATYAERKGTSGWDPESPRVALPRLLVDMVKTPRPFDAVLAFKLDRLTRLGVAEGWSILKTFQDAGVRLVTLHDAGLNVEDPLVFGILVTFHLAIAQQESDNKSVRVTAARAAIRAGTRGGKLGGRPVRVTPEKLADIRRLRGLEPPTAWKDVAQRVGLPAETCRRALWAARREATAIASGEGSDGPAS